MVRQADRNLRGIPPFPWKRFFVTFILVSLAFAFFWVSIKMTNADWQFLVTLFHNAVNGFLTWGWKLVTGIMTFYAMALTIALIAEKKRRK